MTYDVKPFKTLRGVQSAFGAFKVQGACAAFKAQKGGGALAASVSSSEWAVQN